MRQLIIKPRRSGKTTWLKTQYGEYKTKYICLNENVKNELRLHDALTIYQFADQLKNNCINPCQTFLLDEYFRYPKKEREYITKCLLNNNCNFIAIGTSDRLYDSSKVTDILTWRGYIKHNRWSHNILKTEEQMVDKFGSEYMYNLLSYPEVEVTQDTEIVRAIMSEEQYETEILGRLYK